MALPQSPAGKAVGYTVNQWSALTRFCDDGALAIDNNATERALRGTAGRPEGYGRSEHAGGRRADG